MDMFYGELGLSDVPDEVSSNSHLPRFCGHLRGYAHEIVQRMLQGSLFWGRSLVSYVKVPGPIHGHDATPFNRKTETNGTKSNPHHDLLSTGTCLEGAMGACTRVRARQVSCPWNFLSK